MLTRVAIAKSLKCARLRWWWCVTLLLTAAVSSGGTMERLTGKAFANGLPDGRVYELVSPVEKNGSEAGGLAYSVAAPGDEEPSVLFRTFGPLGDVQPSGANFYAVARRSAGRWLTRAAAPRALGVQNLTNTAATLVPSSDLSRVLFTARGSYVPENPYTTGLSSSVYLYGVEDGSLTWVGRPSIEEPDPRLGEINLADNLILAGAATNLQRDYFTYYGTLVPEDEESSRYLEGKSRAEVLATAGGATAYPNDWGLYEWSGGVLRNAAALPSGLYDPYGAVPAATLENGGTRSDDFFNQVSADGSRAFFVSPDPVIDGEQLNGSFQLGRPPELYVHEAMPDGSQRSVLVSRDPLETGIGQPPAPAPRGPEAFKIPGGDTSFVLASSDGSHAFFVSKDRLTAAVPLPENQKWKAYDFDVATGTLTYLPGVVSGNVRPSSLLAASQDGSRMVFVDDATSPATLAMWSEGPDGGTVEPMAELPEPAEGVLTVDPLRVLNGVTVFETNAAVPRFNNGGGFQEVYSFDEMGDRLSCLSCPPTGVAPTGDAHLSTDDVNSFNMPVDSRGVSTDGKRVFFDTPDPLVPQDVNGVRDVYEWNDGRVSPISAGTGSLESYVLDNSASGDNVFFTTADSLVPADSDAGYDVYDARVGGSGEPPAPVTCRGECLQPPSAVPALVTPGGSLTFSGPEDPLPLKAGAPAPKKKTAARRGHRKNRGRSRRRSKAKRRTVAVVREGRRGV
jgi:hypothetical protein